MGVYVTGDIHGDPVRFSSSRFYVQKEFSGDQDENIVIILGDFGLVWNKDGESKDEKWWLDWLESKSFTTVFVDGNHENHKRLGEYKIREWHGGKVHEIRPHVLHLMRGEVFNIEGKKFFAFGGASSHDIKDGIVDGDDPKWKEKATDLYRQGKCMFRIKGLSWWKEELPSEDEMQHGLDMLKENNNTVDFIITHSPSTVELYRMGGRLYKSDVLSNYIDEVKRLTNFTYDKHFFGHMHVDKAIDTNDICFYERIERIL